MTDDTRARILRAALEEFSERGFHATSVRELAERVGITKTAVLYHFPGKADIVTALAEPLLDDLEAAMAEAAAAAAPRAAAIEGLLDVWLGHRHLLRMNLRDLGLTASKTVFDRFRDGMLTANHLVAGADADPAGRPRGRRGRPTVMSPETIEEARRLYDAGHAPAEIATALGVSRATIYRHLPGVE